MLNFDLNGATLPVTWNTANMATNGSLGGLLLHHHNGTGKRAQVVTLQGATTADLGITQSFAPTAPAQSQNVTITLTATNNGPAAATGVVVSALPPSGLVFVFDTVAGAYPAAPVRGTLALFAVGASASINIAATVTGSGPISMTSQVSGSPVDPVASNNSATNTITVAAQTSLAVTNVLSTANPVVAGGSSTFTITLRNSGTDTLFNVWSTLHGRRQRPSPLQPRPAAASTTVPALDHSKHRRWSDGYRDGDHYRAKHGWRAHANGQRFGRKRSATGQQVASVNVVSPYNRDCHQGGQRQLRTRLDGHHTVVLSNSSTTAQLDNAGNEFTDAACRADTG